MSRCVATTVTTWCGGSVPVPDTRRVARTTRCEQWLRFVAEQTCGAGIRSKAQQCQLVALFAPQTHA